MNASDVRIGLVYRYRRLGELYLAVELLESHGDGAHRWLKLTGTDAGKVGTDGPAPWFYWANYQILDPGSGEEQ